MDPSADQPVTNEPPPTYTAQATNPAPLSYGDSQNHTLPSYPEMITAAIMALNEEKGSSRQAIAKYVERVFTNLPPNHSSLLTNHLKLMKNSGHLFMFKHSYMLPRSVPLSVPVPSPSPPPPPSSAAASAGPKRGPGRPPKARPEALPNYVPLTPSQVYQPQPQFVQPMPVFGSEAVFGQPQQPMYVPGFASQPQPHVVLPVGGAAGFSQPQMVMPVSATGPEPESVFVSLGLADGPTPPPTEAVVAKRGRGRPPKAKNGPVAGGPLSVRKARGRPGRPKSVSGAMGMGQVSGLKRGRGRPPRSGFVPVSVAKPRGRPPRKVAKASGRPRGRPPKIGGAAVGGGAVVVPVGLSLDGVLPVRRGRKAGSVFKKTRKLSGKPLGRPRKNATTPIEVSVQQQDEQHFMAYEALKGKLEHVQSRIKLVVSVVKPYLNPDHAGGALAALEELEELATVDVNAAPPPNVVHAQPEQQLQNGTAVAQPQSQHQTQPQPQPQQTM